MFCQYSLSYFSVSVKLLVIGFFPSSTKTKAIFISSWREDKKVSCALLSYGMSCSMENKVCLHVELVKTAQVKK